MHAPTPLCSLSGAAQRAPVRLYCFGTRKVRAAALGPNQIYRSSLPSKRGRNFRSWPRPLLLRCANAGAIGGEPDSSRIMLLANVARGVIEHRVAILFHNPELGELTARVFCASVFSPSPLDTAISDGSGPVDAMTTPTVGAATTAPAKPSRETHQSVDVARGASVFKVRDVSRLFPRHRDGRVSSWRCFR
jgi:hypothetical protein